MLSTYNLCAELLILKFQLKFGPCHCVDISSECHCLPPVSCVSFQHERRGLNFFSFSDVRKSINDLHLWKSYIYIAKRIISRASLMGAIVILSFIALSHVGASRVPWAWPIFLLSPYILVSWYWSLCRITSYLIHFSYILLFIPIIIYIYSYANSS